MHIFFIQTKMMLKYRLHAVRDNTRVTDPIEERFRLDTPKKNIFFNATNSEDSFIS